MPVYVTYIVAAVAAIVLVVLGLVAGRYVSSRIVRGRIVALVGYREAVRAGERNLRAVVLHLAHASDEVILAFASDRAQEDRHSLSELAVRMGAESDELVRMALPKPLWPAADALADAAWLIGRQARRASDGREPEEVLDRLASVDLAAVATAVGAADRDVQGLLDGYGVEEAAVYGGGLYI